MGNAWLRASSGTSILSMRPHNWGMMWSCDPYTRFLILSLLYLSFGSIRDSLMVFSGVLFARVGGVLGLWIRGMPFSVSAGIGLIVASQRNVNCNFQPDNGPPENYVGHINRLGLDLGVKAGGVMAWGVFAPAAGLHHGALAGKYVGGSGSASRERRLNGPL